MKLTLPKKDVFFQFDNFQMTQAINNLIKNAVEADSTNQNKSIQA